MKKNVSSGAWYLIFAAWLLSFIATLGSLFFSEVMNYPPCVLCWYQRICMYPLVLIFLVGLLPLNRMVFKFSIPLVATGWAIGLYHNLLYYKILPKSAAPCAKGISCTTTYIQWGGFITIPLLSFVAFTILLALLIIFYRKFYRN